MRYFGTNIVKNFVIRIFFANFAWKITIKMLKFISFGSGSSGNCYYLYTDTDSILIDVGVGIRILKKHFHNYGLRFEDVHHVLITHDHADHVKSVGSLILTIIYRYIRPVKYIKASSATIVFERR